MEPARAFPPPFSPQSCQWHLGCSYLASAAPRVSHLRELRWTSVPPPNDQVPQCSGPSRASACPFTKPELAQMISEVWSQHTSCLFQKILLEVCLSETFCLTHSSRNHFHPLLQLTPFTALGQEPFAKRGAGGVPSSPRMESQPTDCLKPWESLSFFYNPGSGRFIAIASCVSAANSTRSEYRESTTFRHLFTEPLCVQLFPFLSFCCSPHNHSPREPASSSAREKGQC